MTDKTKIFTMADLSNSNPLTLTERKMLIKGCMSALLEEDDRLSNLGLLLSKYEETVREKELDNQQLLSKVAELEAKNKALEADLDDRKREVNLRCVQIQERDIRIAELTAKNKELWGCIKMMDAQLIRHGVTYKLDGISISKALEELDK